MPKKSSMLMSGLPSNSEKPTDMPTQAPNKVGTMVAASMR